MVDIENEFGIVTSEIVSLTTVATHQNRLEVLKCAVPLPDDRDLQGSSSSTVQRSVSPGSMSSRRRSDAGIVTVPWSLTVVSSGVSSVVIPVVLARL